MVLLSSQFSLRSAKLTSSSSQMESSSILFSSPKTWAAALGMAACFLLFIINYKITYKAGVQTLTRHAQPEHIIIQMLWFKIALLLACVDSAHPLLVSFEAINSTCVNSSYLASNNTPYQLVIPPFSSISIEVDLRHISSLDDLSGVTLQLLIQNNDTSTSYTETLALATSVNTYRLYAANNIVLSASFSIEDVSLQKINARALLIGGSMSALVTPAAPLEQKQASFLFVITKLNLVSLSYNNLNEQSLVNFKGYFLSSIPDHVNMSSRMSSTISYNDYWSGIEQIATPYLPYFSNCNNNGDYLYFSQMIHNASQCSLYGHSSLPINQFKFGSFAVSDQCVISRTCMYDEVPGIASEYPVWNTLDTTSKNIFYITAEEYEAPYAPLPATAYSDTSLVPCKLNSLGDNTTVQYPKKITISIGYYQETAEKRRIMTCDVQFSLYSSSSQNFTYELQLNFAPLSHTKILLNFGFNWYIYMIVFVMIGLISNLQFFIFFVYHYFTSIKREITIRILVCLRMIKQIFRGVFSAVCIILFLIFFVQVIMNGTFFGFPLASSFYSFWDYLVINNIGYFAANSLNSKRAARFGLSYVVVSIYLAWKVSNQLVGKERSNTQSQEYEILGRKFKPFEWNKGKIMYTSLLIVIGSSGYLYFTYSNLFNAYIWHFIVSMQVAQMVLEEIFQSLYGDVLPCLHMKVMVGVLAYLATMGAIDLYYFILGYLVDVAISTIEIAYLTQIQEKITKFVEEKNEEMHKLYLVLLNDEEDEIEKKNTVQNTFLNNSDEVILETILNDVKFLEEQVEQQHFQLNLGEFEPTYREKEIKELFERMMSEKHKESQQYKVKLSESEKKHEGNDLEKKIEKENKKLELLIDATSSVVQYMAQPIVVLILWITYNSSTILSNFQIAYQNCTLYFLSSIILALFYQINIIIIINVLEVYFNFDYQKLIEKLLLRFEKKRTFWITDENCEQKELEHVQTQLRSSYKYSLSAQMYFVVAMFTFAMYIFIIGFNTILSSQVNIFEDPFIILIVLFWILMLSCLEWLLHKIVYFFDIWGCQKFSGKKGEAVPAKEMDAEQVTGQSLIHNQNSSSQQSYSSKKKIFTFKQISEEVKEVNEIKTTQKIVCQSKLQQMCKSLDPLFKNQDFKLQYAIKNKQFIRERIDNILPLITSFPENDSNLLGKSLAVDLPAFKKKAKNVDPLISDLIGGWLKRVENNMIKRKENGVQIERKLKKCSFCFKTWAIYYGYEGTCLECSKIIFDSCRKPKEE